MTRHAIIVTFGGKEMPLYRAAKVCGISDYTLRKRWRNGDRGDELFRPSRARKPPAEELKARREADEAAERAKNEQRFTRQRREQTARERAMLEHAAAFARPLIDGKLVKPKERLAIANRVRSSGQRNWRTNGGGVL